MKALGQKLFGRGLTKKPGIQPYHQQRAANLLAGRQEFTTARDGWRFEADITTGGEIITPVLHDTPETWHDLEFVVVNVRLVGGTTSTSASTHIGVGAHDYGDTTQHATELMELTLSNQDVLIRLSQNPAADRHRGLMHAALNPVPRAGFRSIKQMQKFDRYSAIGFSGFTGGQDGYFEFRTFDGSLDLGVIQAQAKIALGLAAAVPRNAGKLLPMPGERVGDHFRLKGWSELSRDERTASTRSFRELVDLIFTRPLDKAQAAALFAATSWQGSGTIPGGLAIGALDLLRAMNLELRARDGVFSLVFDVAKDGTVALDPVELAHFLLARDIDLGQVLRFVPYGPEARNNAFRDWAAAVTRELERVTGRQLEAYTPRPASGPTSWSGPATSTWPTAAAPSALAARRQRAADDVDRPGRPAVARRRPEYIEFPGGIAHADADETISLVALKQRGGLFTAVVTQLT